MSEVHNETCFPRRRITKRGFGGTVLHPTDRLATYIEDVLPRLHVLRSLDLGQYVEMSLPLWQPTTIKCPLTYLRLPLLEETF
ncbi:unnamed protein product [Adineta ricciae]|uniref:Uncharacterized protein n=1 Tax=Adineta ricciae TaxID=249248 RepID=A0A815NSX3_ADIRI|nr:unnamed protein product [Adineta ricciae]